MVFEWKYFTRVSWFTQEKRFFYAKNARENEKLFWRPKVAAKGGKDQKWIKDRKGKGEHIKFILYLLLNDHKGFHWFIWINYEQFI